MFKRTQPIISLNYTVSARNEVSPEAVARVIVRQNRAPVAGSPGECRSLGPVGSPTGTQVSLFASGVSAFGIDWRVWDVWASLVLLNGL